MAPGPPYTLPASPLWGARAIDVGNPANAGGISAPPTPPRRALRPPRRRARGCVPAPRSRGRGVPVGGSRPSAAWSQHGPRQGMRQRRPGTFRATRGLRVARARFRCAALRGTKSTTPARAANTPEEQQQQQEPGETRPLSPDPSTPPSPAHSKHKSNRNNLLFVRALRALRASRAAAGDNIIIILSSSRERDGPHSRPAPRAGQAVKPVRRRERGVGKTASD